MKRYWKYTAQMDANNYLFACEDGKSVFHYVPALDSGTRGTETSVVDVTTPDETWQFQGEYPPITSDEVMRLYAAERQARAHTWKIWLEASDEEIRQGEVALSEARKALFAAGLSLL